MEIVILLVIGGYAFYGIYLLLLSYGHIIVPVALVIGLLPIVFKYGCKGLDIYDRRLNAHRKAESQHRDLFLRFSGKKRYLFILHKAMIPFVIASLILANETVKYINEYIDDENWIYEIPRDYRFLEEPFYWVVFFILIVAFYRLGLKAFNACPTQIKLFPSYKAMRRHANKTKHPRVALEHAYALREAATHQITSPYDLFLAIEAIFTKDKDTLFYKSARLHDTLNYLEKHFPHTHEDEEFRRKYWNYARHIFTLLYFRGAANIEQSFFALPYPEIEKIKEQDTQNALQKEREKFQNQPLDLWSKSPDQINLEDALEIIGMTKTPPIKILHKLHIAVLEEHKDDPKKAQICAKAFEILGHEAVIKEFFNP